MREPISRFIKSNGSSKKVLPIFLLVIFLGLFAFARPAAAGVSTYVWSAVGAIGELFAGLMGRLLLFIINFLIKVSGYNNFINSGIVSVGWKLVRDVANMFYILLMLVMAFGTMLKLNDQYSWKKMLPRLIGTAILVNFSKTIIGLLIDFGQVIMLTFVNAYAATAGGNFAQMFGIKQILAQSASGSKSKEQMSMENALGFVLGAVVLAVTAIVTGVFAIILLMRIVTLWILIILSPFAFLLGTFEKGRQYYSQWWKELINGIIVGPIVAFFLWLVLATMGQGGMISEINTNNAVPETYRAQQPTSKGGYQDIAGTEISQWENMGSLFVVLAMLFYALQQIQSLSLLGGDLARGASGMMKKAATTAAKKVAVPMGLAVATGGSVPAAFALQQLAKTGIGVGKQIPLVGGAFKGLAKEGDKLGLRSEKGIGGYLGRKGGGLVSQGKEAILNKGIARVPLLGTFARGTAADLKGERLKVARETGKKVSEYKDDDVLRAASRKTTITSESQTEKFEAIGRLVNEPQTRKRLGITDEQLETMAGQLPELGDKLGQSERAAGWVKKFEGDNLRMIKDPDKQKKRVQGIHPNKVQDISDDDISSPEVSAAFRPEQVAKMSEHQKELRHEALTKDKTSDEIIGMINAGTIAPSDIDLTKLGDRGVELVGTLIANGDAKNISSIARASEANASIMQNPISRALASEASVLSAMDQADPGIQVSLQRREMENELAEKQNIRSGKNEQLAAGHKSGMSYQKKAALGQELVDLDSEIADLQNMLSRMPQGSAIPQGYKEQAERVESLRQAGIASSTTKDEALQAAAYSRPSSQDPNDRGAFSQRGGEALSQQAANWGDNPPAWLKDLKVEEIVKVMPNGDVNGVTQLGRVLTNLTNVNQLLLWATKNSTTSQRQLIASLIAAKKYSASPDAAAKIEKRMETPAFEDLSEEIQRLSNILASKGRL